jgi:release factor glutamine methyltransferase
LEWVIAQQLPARPVIVDVCTGSGALALALAHYRADLGLDARIIAVDDSDAALDYARRNAEGTAVELVRADVAVDGLLPELDGQVDVVVANPPYIPDAVELDAEVAQHDPHHALFGGPDGMSVITAVVGLAGRWLRPGGLFAVEHDDTTSSQTAELLCSTGLFDDIRARHDLVGRPRFVTARRSGADDSRRDDAERSDEVGAPPACGGEWRR